jgi:hypothetical protein
MSPLKLGLMVYALVLGFVLVRALLTAIHYKIVISLLKEDIKDLIKPKENKDE